MVPHTEYEIKDTWFVAGLCATGSQDILVNDAFVPSYRTRRMVDNFNCVGAGQTLNQSPLYKIPFGQIFFRGVSSPSIGALQAMLNTVELRRHHSFPMHASELARAASQQMTQ